MEDFKINNGVLEKYIGKGGDVVIPESVTEIGGGAFSGCKNLTSVNIPESVTEIGDEAFSGCKSLTSVNIPESVTKIGERAFSRCKSLTSVNIPESVTKIGDEAFYGCTSLTSVNIPESVTKIGDWAFSDCTSLTSVNIPESVTEIGGGAFSGCKNLTSVNIPESVTKIGKLAFHNTKFIQELAKTGNGYAVVNNILIEYLGNDKKAVIPDNVTKIGERAFSGCKSLTSANIPESVTKIGDWAFSSCKSLTSVNIPESVTKIGGGAFSSCESLTSVNIPESVTKINKRTFYCCASLTSVNIPKSVTEIGSEAFSGCESLTSVNIPENVTEIGSEAFSGCKNLTSVNIPKSVTKINERTFYCCSSLTSLNIPESVTEIGSCAFPLYFSLKYKDKLAKKGYSVSNDDILSMLNTSVEQGKIYPDLYIAYFVLSGKQAAKICREVFDNAPERSFAEMVKWLSENEIKTGMYKKAVDYALTFSNKINAADIKALYNIMTANKAGKAAEQLKPYLPDENGTAAKQTYDNPIEKLCHEMFTEYEVKKMDMFSSENIKYKDGGAAPEFVVKCAFYPYYIQLKERPKHIGDYGSDFSKFNMVPEADKIAAALDPKGLHELIDGYVKNISVNDIFEFAPLCRYADGAQLDSMAANISKWKSWYVYGSSGRSAIIVMKGALLLNDTKEAMIRAEKLKLLDAYAEMRGTTANVLRNTVMIDFGLDDSGCKMLDLGNKVIKAYLGDDLTVTLFDTADNKLVKSLPKKGADAEKYDSCSAALKDMKKNIKKVIKDRTALLRKEFVDPVPMASDDWKKVYVNNPVMNKIAVTLVWQSNNENRRFIPAKDGSIIDCDGNAVVISDTDTISVANPIDCPSDEIDKWKNYLSENKIAQTFTQMFEPVYDLSGIDVKKRYEGIGIPLFLIRGMSKDGITVDSEMCESTINLYLSGNAVSASVYPESYDEKTGYGWFESGTFSINSIPIDTSVVLKNMRVDNSNKKLNHDIFVLDRVYIEAALRAGKTETVIEMSRCITEKNIDRLIEIAQEIKKTECIAWLLNYKNENFGFSFPDLSID